jgi:two-component system, LytTR family, response regulator
MIKAIALDDEPPALEVIESFCDQADYIDLVKTFTRHEEALKYISQFPVDLLFLDINMPSISGIDFKKLLDPKTMVIFTTAYSEFAIEGFNLNAVDYLLKPFTPERFLQATEKARAYFQFLHQNALAKADHIMIRVNYVLTKINLAEIVFIEGLDDYLKIYLEGQKTVVARMTMKAILEKLPQSDFVRVHRSFIVPLARIETIRNKMVVIGGEEIPIGVSYEKKFFELMGR